MGDMGTGREDQKKVAAAMIQQAKSDSLNFILTVGDNIYEKGVTSADDPLWKSAIEDVYNDPALMVPIYASLGNHDHYGVVEAQLEYAKKNKRWKMPGRYYTFIRTLADMTDVQFFAIDTYPITNEKAAEKYPVEPQLEWLDKALGESKARWKIVFGHHPLYSHVEKPREIERQAMIRQVEPLLIKHKVDLCLFGHDHTLEMLKPVNGVNHVITGASAGPDKAYGVVWNENEAFYASTGDGFTFYRVSKNELVIEFVRMSGETQFVHVLNKSGT